MDVITISEASFEQVEMASSQTEQTALEQAMRGLAQAAQWNKIDCPDMIQQKFSQQQLRGETGTSQPGMLTADEQLQVLRSMGSQDLLVHIAAQTDRVLIKLRQTEKAVHFPERRSDMAASLPSEWPRHLAGLRCEYAAARLAGNSQAAREVAGRFQSVKTDAVYAAFAGGCLRGMIRLVWLSCHRL